MQRTATPALSLGKRCPRKVHCVMWSGGTRSLQARKRQPQSLKKGHWCSHKIFNHNYFCSNCLVIATPYERRILDFPLEMNARDVARELKREGWHAWAPFGAATAPSHGLSCVHERAVDIRRVASVPRKPE